MPATRRTQGTRFMEDRYIQIQKILVHWHRTPHLRGRLIPAKDIADRIGVDVSMIRRDVDELIIARGLPIEKVRGHGGGYRLFEDITSFPDVQLSSTELYILFLGARALASQRGLASEERMLSTVNKLFSTLDEAMAVDLRRLEQLVTFRPGGYEAPVDLEVFDTVLRALLDQEELTFLHTKPDPGAQPRHRHVHPRHLATIMANWYLFTDDLGSEGARRHFALTRVRDVQRTGKYFIPTAPFDLDEELNDSVGVHTAGEKHKIHLRFTPAVRAFIMERKWHRTQQLIPLEDGGVDLIFTAPVNQELMRLVLHWGADVTVLAPTTLRDSIVAEAQRLVANYTSQTP